MAKDTFSNWRLSSSDSEDDHITKGVLLTVKNRKMSSASADRPSRRSSILDEYVPLADRLKRRRQTVSQEDSDDNLPSFPLPSKLYKENETDLNVVDLSKESQWHFSSASLPELEKPSVNSGYVNLDDERLLKNDIQDKPVGKDLSAHLKALKPGECLRYMECKISSKLRYLFEKFDLFNEIKKDIEVTCSLVDNDLPCVTWLRKLTSDFENQMQEDRAEPNMIVAVSASDFVKMVGASHNNEEETLSAWVGTLRKRSRYNSIHVVCCGFEKYNKSLKEKKSRQMKRRSCGRKNKKTVVIPDVSVLDIETASVELQINHNVMITYVEKPEDFATMVKQITKAVAEAPYKRMKRQDIQFINEMPSVKINANTGEGKRKAWKQMIQQFHNVTTVMATAIVDRYPSVVALMDAYEKCGSDVTKAEMLLADIAVRRGVGTIQTNRRIGPELSYKIYRQFSSSDPSERLY